MDEFHLDPLIADELLVPSFKPKVERRGDAIYVVLHFPEAHPNGSRPEQEMDFVIGKQFLITTRYGHIDPLHAFAKAFEVQTVLGRGHAVHGGHLFTALTHSIYKSLIDECDTMRHKLDAIEDHIFSGDERKMVIALSQTGRTIHDFRQALLPHREMLVSLESAAARMFDQGFSYWVREVIGAYERVVDTLEHLRDALHELRDTNDSLLTTKQNEVMKLLTMMAFITFPLVLIVDILNLHTSYVPIVGMAGDFWIIMGLLAVLTAALLAFFKHRDWL